MSSYACEERSMSGPMIKLVLCTLEILPASLLYVLSFIVLESYLISKGNDPSIPDRLRALRVHWAHRPRRLGGVLPFRRRALCRTFVSNH